MSPEPCRPFDKHRRGLSLGEGAGIIILEEYTHAIERGAAILAEMAGYAVNADAYHMTSPDPEGLGMFRVMSSALDRAGIETQRVDYINAHGTATKINDHMEAQAIQRLFGKKNLRRITVSSTKSMVGHCLGASGAIEAIATILALNQQAAPPTVHLDEPDPLCKLNHVAHLSRKQKIRIALSNSFAFGGNNTSLVFKQVGLENR
jgi:3-oxoacyl-[acyl-carrier-protein] synthase II